ncbi:hypothetical protein GQ55_9G015000 [Panicum hallii var. hallii]|uniref:Uncharacterized protein n=1 Tax=Panicum hallii var. hallii TaxID=1504633 RepID=A0A2T7BYG5_9POAL|nr:hypothetical protein GQ55_9G015000 [Panicum hallii var. hallii]
MRRSRGVPSARGATARRSCSSPARAPLLLTSRAVLALPFDGESLRREGWRRLEQGGGEGSTLTHTRSTCTALLLPVPHWDAPVGDVASPPRLRTRPAASSAWAAAGKGAHASSEVAASSGPAAGDPGASRPQ